MLMKHNTNVGNIYGLYKTQIPKCIIK